MEFNPVSGPSTQTAELYRLPGDPVFKDRDLQRYRETNKDIKTSVAVSVEKIKEGLNDPDASVRYTAIEQIQHVPENERAELNPLVIEEIKKGLNDQYTYVRYAAIGQIQHVPENERAELYPLVIEAIKKGLNDPDASVRYAAIKQIQHVPENERAELYPLVIEEIKKGLNDQYTYVRRLAIKQIQHVPENERAELYPLVIEEIKKGLNDPDASVRYTAIKQIQHVPENERAELYPLVIAEIKEGLEDTNPEGKRRLAIELLLALSPDIQQNVIESELKEQSEDKREQIRALVVTTPLYKNIQDRFFRQKFDKTGSETTLLDKSPGHSDTSLRERVIIRHIPLHVYETWKQAYEAVDVWMKLGFSYVPVEPIVSVRASKQAELVDVFTRVIKGPSVATWEQRTLLYVQEIHKQMDKIKEGLEQLGIRHGHTYTGNFLVMFERNAEGEPDLTKPPRVYLIDFDEAVSP